MSVSIQKLAKFDPPGYPDVDDGLTDPQKLAWSQKISDWMDFEIAGDDESGQRSGRTKLPQFFNGTVIAYDVSQQPAAITWIGFPNLVSEGPFIKKYSSFCDRYESATPMRLGDGRRPTAPGTIRTSIWSGPSRRTTTGTSKPSHLLVKVLRSVHLLSVYRKAKY